MGTEEEKLKEAFLRQANARIHLQNMEGHSENKATAKKGKEDIDELGAGGTVKEAMAIAGTLEGLFSVGKISEYNSAVEKIAEKLETYDRARQGMHIDVLVSQAGSGMQGEGAAPVDPNFIPNNWIFMDYYPLQTEATVAKTKYAGFFLAKAGGRKDGALLNPDALIGKEGNVVIDFRELRASEKYEEYLAAAGIAEKEIPGGRRFVEKTRFGAEKEIDMLAAQVRIIGVIPMNERKGIVLDAEAFDGIKAEKTGSNGGRKAAARFS